MAEMSSCTVRRRFESCRGHTRSRLTALLLVCELPSRRLVAGGPSSDFGLYLLGREPEPSPWRSGWVEVLTPNAVLKLAGRYEGGASSWRIASATEVGVANNIDYFEIGSPDPEAAKAFYGTLFGWEIGAPSSPAQYSMVDEGRGGLWDTSAIGGGNWAIFYVHVDDVQVAIDQAQALGATVAVPLTDNGAIEFAHLIDPLGNRLGIWRPKSA